MPYRPETYVYVDGFNLYYGAIKNTPFKWLNISALCRLLLPRNQIARIKYFTARVKGRRDDPNQPARQQAFIRALCTLPEVEIVYGHFLANAVYMPLADSTLPSPQYVKVIKTEEKGSDVNMATHLLCDGFRNKYQAAVLVTNDSDMLAPVRIVRQELGFVVGILNPHRRVSRVLGREASFVKQIRRGVLATSQFPSQLRDSHGIIKKPPQW